MLSLSVRPVPQYFDLYGDLRHAIEVYVHAQYSLEDLILIWF